MVEGFGDTLLHFLPGSSSQHSLLPTFLSIVKIQLGLLLTCHVLRVYIVLGQA
jgi:hypothetical protein